MTTTPPQSKEGHRVSTIQRRASIGDKLITKGSATSGCSGFGLVEEPDATVYLIPGTELAFDKDIQYHDRFSVLRFRVEHKKARFRQFSNDSNASRFALELADGLLVMLAELAAGQTATVVRVPFASPSESG
jgi:hypothetical protein